MQNNRVGHTALSAAELIQSRFKFNDAGDVIGFKTLDMSDFLGSDWASEKGFDNYTSPVVFYRAVRATATKKYGELPF